MDSDTGERPSTRGFHYQNLPDICDSTDEKMHLLKPSTSEIESSDFHHLPPWNMNSINDSDFNTKLEQVKLAIESEVLPVRIAAGSSGSYFARNHEGKTVAVFKPKDEEPYGRFNPKWSKWFHKTFCPCCFGRSCLVPNQGYLSEAGASIIDIKLNLNIVPRTCVVRLAASSFNYPAYKRHWNTAKREFNQSVGRRVFQSKGLPSKIGSFQLFVENYIDADIFLKQIEQNALSEEAKDQFQKQFERMVVLDYIIRNTDRNNGNWLVKYDLQVNNVEDKRNEEGEFLPADADVQSDTTYQNSDTVIVTNKSDIRIAAIDNGLAFPFKHPDEWRAYPFHWAWLPQAKIPFSEEIKSLVLPLLSDMNWVESELCGEIQRLFAQDKNYIRHIAEGQLAVMRGQILNLVQAMRDNKSPFQLVQMTPIFVERASNVFEPRTFRQKFSDRYPVFACC